VSQEQNRLYAKNGEGDPKTLKRLPKFHAAELPLRLPAANPTDNAVDALPSDVTLALKQAAVFSELIRPMMPSFQSIHLSVASCSSDIKDT
jgi:hypothetical protein